EGSQRAPEGGAQQTRNEEPQKTPAEGTQETHDEGRDGRAQESSGGTEAKKGRAGAEPAVRAAVRVSAEPSLSAGREQPEKTESPEKPEVAPKEEPSGKTAAMAGASINAEDGTDAEAAPHRPLGPFVSEDDSPTGVALFKAVKTPPPTPASRPF